jgi:hypothetical protein
MRNLEKIFKQYLDAVGGREPVELGGGPKVDLTSSEGKGLLARENANFVKRLSQASSFNKRLVLSLTVLHFLIFLVAAAFLVLHYRDSPTGVTSVFGGSVVSLLGLTTGLRVVWRNKVTMDLLIAILPNLAPDQQLSAVQSLSFGQLGSRRRLASSE